jgi:hypothetical protein
MPARDVYLDGLLAPTTTPAAREGVPNHLI